MEFISEPEAKISVIWMLGEFGENIQDAPYILESFINNVGEANETNTEVKQTVYIIHHLESSF